MPEKQTHIAAKKVSDLESISVIIPMLFSVTAYAPTAGSIFIPKIFDSYERVAG